MLPMKIKPTTNLDASAKWWADRRLKYNKGLIAAGVSAFLLYAILGSMLIAPHVNDFEITLFTIFFQGIGYLIMMGIANIFYGLGPLLDELYNISNDERFRQRLFNFGYWFSFALPFSIPVFIVITYFLNYAN